MNLDESFSVAELKNGRYGVFDLREGGRKLCSCHISKSSAKNQKKQLIQAQSKEASTKIALETGGFNEEQDIGGPEGTVFQDQQMASSKIEARQLRRLDIKSRLNKIKSKKTKLHSRGVET